MADESEAENMNGSNGSEVPQSTDGSKIMPVPNEDDGDSVSGGLYSPATDAAISSIIAAIGSTGNNDETIGNEGEIVGEAPPSPKPTHDLEDESPLFASSYPGLTSGLVSPATEAHAVPASAVFKSSQLALPFDDKEIEMDDNKEGNMTNGKNANPELVERSTTIISMYKDFLKEKEEEEKRAKESANQHVSNASAGRANNINFQSGKNGNNFQRFDPSVGIDVKRKNRKTGDSSADGHSDKHRATRMSTMKSRTKEAASKAASRAATAMKNARNRGKPPSTDDIFAANKNAEMMYNDYDFQSYDDYDSYNQALAPPVAVSDDGNVISVQNDHIHSSFDEEDARRINDNDNLEGDDVENEPLNPGRKRRHETYDVDDESPSFFEICAELGVSSQTHSNMRSFYKTSRNLPKKIKRSIQMFFLLIFLAFLAVSIAAAVTKGFESARRKRVEKEKPLGDWKAEEDRMKKEQYDWDMAHGTGGPPNKPPLEEVEIVDEVEEAMPPPPNMGGPGASGPMNAGISEQDELFQYVSAAYRPEVFDRSSGWEGQTYQEAINFCNSYAGFIPCPYEVYCPASKGSSGAGSKLLTGVLDHKGESWAPVINSADEWVQVGTGKECALYSELYGKKPSWGWDGVNNEAVTRHVMCCRSAPLEIPGGGNDASGPDGSLGLGNVQELPDTPTAGKEEKEKEDITAPSMMDQLSPSDLAFDDMDQSTPSEKTEWEAQVEKVNGPSWYGEEFGWGGTTHEDAQSFCENVPSSGCPGCGDDTLHLCPLQAYCPNGPILQKPLYLQMDAFQGEQWAPLSNGPNAWVMIGNIRDVTQNNEAGSATMGDPLTCRTYMELYHKNPSWGVDGSSTSLKRHILCCERNFDGDASSGGGGAYIGSVSGDGAAASVAGGVDGGGQSIVDNAAAATEAAQSPNDGVVTQEFDDKEQSIINVFHPVWYHTMQGVGWNGGSHDDAREFCKEQEGENGKPMEICPFDALCPNGPSQPVISNHNPVDFNQEGEQWAPIYGKENHWVLISKKNNNSATQCLTYFQLNNKTPDWGTDGSRKEIKMHVLCCSTLQ